MTMYRIILSVVFFVLIHYCNAQDKLISGSVKSNIDSTSLGYVSIGVVNKSLGTISREDGSFLLKVNQNVIGNDLINFSLIGYKDNQVSMDQLMLDKGVVYLVPYLEGLPEILITKKHVNSYRIGNVDVGKMLFKFYSLNDTSNDDQLGREQGMIFNVENDFVIDKVNFHIGCNEYNDLKLRLKIYDVKDGKFGEIINKEDILFDIKDNEKGMFSLDLERYNLIVKNRKQIGVGLEWLGGLVEDEAPKCFGLTYVKGKNRDAFFKMKSEAPTRYMKHDLTLFLDVTEIEVK